MYRVVLIVSLFVIPVGLINANISAISTAGGSVSPRNDTEIKLESEKINIHISEKTVSYKLVYILFNQGNSGSIDIGFPKWKTKDAIENDFNELQIIVNDKLINYQIVPTLKKLSEVGMSPQIIKWYTFNYAFKENESIKIEISYNTNHGKLGNWCWDEYLFGTGGNWFSNINELKIVIDLDEDIWVTNFYIGSYPKRYPNIDIKRIGKKSFEVTLQKIKPQMSDMVGFVFETSPLYMFSLKAEIFKNTPPYGFTYSKYKLEDKDLQFLSYDNLQYYKAFLFALAGFNISDASIGKLIQNMHITPDNNLRNNDVWKYDIQLINEYLEKAKK